jgi:hypothetical protein
VIGLVASHGAPRLFVPAHRGSLALPFIAHGKETPEDVDIRLLRAVEGTPVLVAC